MGPKLKVVKESSRGLNELFLDISTGETLTRLQVKQRIYQGRYPAYEYYYSEETLIIRSKPDSSSYYDLD